MSIKSIFNHDHEVIDYVGIQTMNFFPEGYRPADRWDLLSRENFKLKIDVDYLIESFVEPGIYFIFNTTKNPQTSLELKPWFEAGKVWVKDEKSNKLELSGNSGQLDKCFPYQ